MEIGTPAFWLAVLQIIAIDIVLSGDNAVVIALACRNLSATQRLKGIFWGVAGAVGLRVALTAFAAGLLGYPYLKLGGGIPLRWIGVKMLLPEEGNGREVRAPDHLGQAVKTIVVADFVMSLDNIVAVAAAARDHLGLLIFGLALSIPLIIWSSQLIMGLMDRFPAVVTLGAGLIGYVGGDMMVSDASVRDRAAALFPAAEQSAGLLAAVVVVGLGLWLARRAANATAARKILSGESDDPVSR